MTGTIVGQKIEAGKMTFSVWRTKLTSAANKATFPTCYGLNIRDTISAQTIYSKTGITDVLSTYNPSDEILWHNIAEDGRAITNGKEFHNKRRYSLNNHLLGNEIDINQLSEYRL